MRSSHNGKPRIEQKVHERTDQIQLNAWEVLMKWSITGKLIFILRVGQMF
jgi:hypothetical protein